MDLLFTVIFWFLVFVLLYLLYVKVSKIEEENKELKLKLENAMLDCTVKQMHIDAFLKEEEKKEVWLWIYMV